MTDYTYPRSMWGTLGICPFCGLWVYVGPYGVVTRDTDEPRCENGQGHKHSLSPA